MQIIKLRMFILVLPLIAMMAPVVFAEPRNTPQLNSLGVNKIGPPERTKYAKELLTFIKEIDDQIPSLSPSQEKWLQNEIGNSNLITRRYIEATQTKEYNINVVKKNFAGTMYALNKVIANLGEKKRTPHDEKKEIYWWSIINDYLLDNELWQSLLILIEDYKIVDRKMFYSDSDRYDNPNEQMHLFFMNNAYWPSRQILRSIIEPYLEK